MVRAAHGPGASPYSLALSLLSVHATSSTPGYRFQVDDQGVVRYMVQHAGCREMREEMSVLRVRSLKECVGGVRDIS